MTTLLPTLATALGGIGLAHYLAQPVTAKVIARWSKLYVHAATKPSKAVFTVLSQVSRQLAEAMDAEDAARGTAELARRRGP